MVSVEIPQATTGRLAAQVEAAFVFGLRETGSFFMGRSDVQAAASELADRLGALDIPYAIIGAMALNAYGYRRATTDVNVLVTRDGLHDFKAAWLGRGYVERFPGSKNLRDTVNNVKIDVVIAGNFPGDGKTKPVAFPDPAECAVSGDRFRLVPLAKLIELKLASGMTAPHRLRDLADVIELVRVNSLPSQYAESLDPFVRDKYLEMWNAAQTAED